MKYLNHDDAEKQLKTIKNLTAALDLIEFSIEKDEDSGMLILSDSLDPSYGYNGEESFVDLKEVAEFISSIGFFEETVVQTLENAILNIASNRDSYDKADELPTKLDAKSIGTYGNSLADALENFISKFPALEYYLREGDYGGDIDMLRAVTRDKDTLDGVRNLSSIVVMESKPLENDNYEHKIGVRAILDYEVSNHNQSKTGNEVTLIFEPPVKGRDEFVLNNITFAPIDEIKNGVVFPTVKSVEENKVRVDEYPSSYQLNDEALQRALNQANEVAKGLPALTLEDMDDWLMNEVEDEKLVSFNAQILNFRADICEQLIQAAQDIECEEPRMTENGKEVITHKGLSFEAKATLRGEAPDFDYYYDAYAEFKVGDDFDAVNNVGFDNVMISINRDGEYEYVTIPADKLPVGLEDAIVEALEEKLDMPLDEYAKQEQEDLDKDNIDFD